MLARVETQEPDGWRGLTVDEGERRKAVRVVVAAGLDAVASRDVLGMMVDVADALGARLRQEHVVEPRPTPVVLVPGMLLVAATAKTPGREIRLVERHGTDPVVWVATTIRHPKAPDRVGKLTTIGEVALLRDWRVVPEQTAEAGS